MFLTSSHGVTFQKIWKYSCGYFIVVFLFTWIWHVKSQVQLSTNVMNIVTWFSWHYVYDLKLSFCYSCNICSRACTQACVYSWERIMCFLDKPSWFINWRAESYDVQHLLASHGVNTKRQTRKEVTGVWGRVLRPSRAAKNEWRQSGWKHKYFQLKTAPLAEQNFKLWSQIKKIQ